MASTKKSSAAKSLRRRSAQARPKPIPQKVRAFMATRVAGAFDSLKEIVDTASDNYQQLLVGVPKAHLEAALDDLVEAHKANQTTWKRPTDCDRLDMAFCKLDGSGIIARQNWTCCATDGLHEIAAEMDAAAKAGRPTSGYVFYHSQETDNAIKDGMVLLLFGSKVDRKKATIAVGEAVVRACQSEGLATAWSGDVDDRIEVMIEWKRFRDTPSRPANVPGIIRAREQAEALLKELCAQTKTGYFDGWMQAKRSRSCDGFADLLLALYNASCGVVSEHSIKALEFAARYPDWIIPSVYNNLFYVYLMTKRYADALPLMAEALCAAPLNPGIYHNAACILAQLGRLDESLTCVTLAKEHGYVKLASMKSDTYLAPIAKRKEFKAIFATSKKRVK